MEINIVNIIINCNKENNALNQFLTLINKQDTLKKLSCFETELLTLIKPFYNLNRNGRYL